MTGTRPKLRLLGEPKLTSATGQTVGLPRLAYSLAVRLLAAAPGHALSRRELADRLWPDNGGADANLRQLLRRIRDAEDKASTAIFEIGPSSVRLRVDSFDCDVIALEACLASLDLARASEALDLFGPGVLGGTFERGDGPGDWIADHDHRLRARLSAGLSALLDGEDGRDNPAAAQRLADRLLAVDPTCEAAWRSLMRANAAAGQRSRVAALFADCREVLKRDLGVSPAPATVALYERLTGGVAGPPLLAAVPGAPPPQTFAAAAFAFVPRLVVLPPPAPEGAVDSPDALAASLIEEVVVRLCSLNSIRVVAAHTAWKLRANDFDEATADRFQIGYVAESIVQSRGGEYRLSVKLFERSGRTMLWADVYRFGPDSGESCFRSICLGIVHALADAVERYEIARMADSVAPNAYYWHLVGQRHLRQVDLPDTRRAKAAFRRAIRSDREFAAAHSGLARALQREWLLLGEGNRALLEEAETSGQRAVQADGRDARGFHELGLSSLYLLRFDDSIAYYAQAERLAPQRADILADYADALAHCGEHEQGLAKMEQAIDLNPLPPDQYWWDLAGMQFHLGRYRDAIRSLSKMERPTARMRLAAACWAMLGETERARACAADFLESYPDFRIDAWLALVPNRNPEDTRHYETALRAAGFQ